MSFIIITRFIEAYDSIINEYPESNVVFAKDKKDIDSLFFAFPAIKACFYPSNTGNNSHLLYQTNIKHIFIGHGDSDKSASAHKFFRVYDENWVAGNAHIDRFKNAGFELNGLEQVKVGRPSLYKVIKSVNNDKWQLKCDGSYNILYLPTWEGILQEQNYSSLEIIEKNINILPDDHNLSISIKLHPLTGQREKNFTDLERLLSENNNCDIIPKSETLNKYIESSNIFICDISAVVSECLAANAPIFLYMPKDKEIKISSSNMPYEEYCYIYSTPEELKENIQKVIKGDDYLFDNRVKASEYILNSKDTLNKTFIKRLQHLGERNV